MNINKRESGIFNCFLDEENNIVIYFFIKVNKKWNLEHSKLTCAR